MIIVDNLSFRYGNSGKAALQEIRMTVSNGEFIVLTGPSGCGKTTLTRVMNRLCPEFYGGEVSGSYLINGENMLQTSVYEASLKIGSVFQDPRTQFFTKDTISEVAFGCENRGMKQREIIDRTDRAFCELGLEHLKGSNLLELSSGERQFIAIASVCCTDPDIFVFDEPSANLDTEAIERLRKLLYQLKEKGKTIVVSEHRLYYLKGLADRIIIMKDGQIAQELSAGMLEHIGVEGCADLGLRRFYRTEKITEDFSMGSELTGLEIEHLCFQYRYKELLYNDASFFFPRGRVVGVTGKNGCGKTTLLELICGLRKSSSEKFCLDGRSMNAKARTAEFYYVMQDVDYQMFTESVWTEMMLNSEDQSDKERAERILRKFGLYEVRDRHPAALSGGQKQRLSIAVACMKNSEVICFDEPTSGLDYMNMKNISAAIRTLANEKRVIIVVSHDDELLENVCDYIIKVDEY